MSAERKNPFSPQGVGGVLQLEKHLVALSVGVGMWAPKQSGLYPVPGLQLGGGDLCGQQVEIIEREFGWGQACWGGFGGEHGS